MRKTLIFFLLSFIFIRLHVEPENPFFSERTAYAADTPTYYLFGISGTDDPSVVAKSANKGVTYWKTSASVGIYQKQDNGSSTNWTKIAGSTPSGTANQIPFFDGAAVFTTETGIAPASFTWLTATKRLGLRTNAPQSVFHTGLGSTVGAVNDTAIILGVPDAAAVIGANAVVMGSGNIASGAQSTAEGTSTSSTSQSTHAEGNGTTAGASYAHVEGDQSFAGGVASHSEGHQNAANGNHAHAEGSLTHATGDDSHSEGNGTFATNIQAHAEGAGATTASGQISHAEGSATTASGNMSHSEGEASTAAGNDSHSEGNSTQANGDQSHAGGLSSIAGGTYSFAHGRKAQTGAFAGTFSLADSQNFTSTNPAADTFKARYQNGFCFVKGGGADDTDGVNYCLSQATVDTTNNTATTLQLITPATNTSVAIGAKVIGRRTGGAAGTAGDTTYVSVQSVCKNVGGVVTASAVPINQTLADNVVTAATIDASGADCRVRVTGDTNNNYTWNTTTTTQVK